MKRQELLDAYQSGARDFSYADLQKENLAYVQIPGADLSHANLNGANCTGADLRRVNLSGAHMQMTDLTMADLSGAAVSRQQISTAIADLGTVTSNLQAPVNDTALNHRWLETKRNGNSAPTYTSTGAKPR